MRRAAVLIVLGVIAGACGLDESGLVSNEGGVDANLPEACTTLDAACLGAVDSVWTPVTLGDAGCSAGFNATQLKTNPQDTPASCACGACSVVGAYACEAGVPISGGDGCGDDPFATATPGQCTDVTSTQHLLAHGQNATGSVGCFAANDAGTGATSEALTVCVPGCSADFCGAAHPCVMAEGDVACPAGFTLAAHAGTGVDPGCGPCPCEAGAPGACGGTVTAFFQNGCNAVDDAGTYAVETCNDLTPNHYKSVFVALTPPDASCAVTAQPTGDASLLGLKTICCR
ncbi:MAG TPA: hypothetical protein VGH28_32960 [Polyangiaceae bacterium]|jgi:hypothetical protein